MDFIVIAIRGKSGQIRTHIQTKIHTQETKAKTKTKKSRKTKTKKEQKEKKV